MAQRNAGPARAGSSVAASIAGSIAGAAGLTLVLLFGLPVALDFAADMSRSVAGPGGPGLEGGGTGQAGSTGLTGGGPVVLAISSTTTTVTAHNDKHGTITSSEAGRPVHVAVTVRSAAGNPTGSVKVSWFQATASCKGDSVASTTVALSNGVVDATTLVATPLTPQSISFRADYGGTADFSPSSTCIGVTITKATPSMTTAVHDAAHNTVTFVYVTQAAHERVSVAGAAAVPTGTVTIELLTGTDCTGTMVTRTVRTLGASAVVEGSNAFFGTPNAGSYRATYSGDAVYNGRTGTCRPIEWRKATPSLTLELHNGTNHTQVLTAIIPSSLHPKATITGPLGTPSGGTWRVYSYNAEDCGGTQIGFALLPLTTGSVDDSAINLSDLSAPGIASYQTRYTGDDKYLQGNSQCVDVGMKALVEVTLDVHDEDHGVVSSATIFDAIHGATTVSGDFDTPTGTVEIRLYGATGCSSSFETISRSLSAGAVDDAAATFVLESTTARSMMVHYQGNFDYVSNESICRAISVGKATPSVQAQVHDAAHQVVSSVGLGTTVHARVTAGGVAGGPTPAGSVSVAFFAGDTCSGAAVAGSDKVSLSGGAADIVAFTQAPAIPGTYAFRPQFAGDTSYNTTSGPCATFVVLAPGATPPPTPSPTPTAAPGATTGPGASFDPGASEAPGSGAPGTTSPGISAAPGESGLVSASGAPAPSDGAGASPGGTSPPSGSADAGSGGPGFAIVLILGGLLAAVVLVTGLGFVLRRSRHARLGGG